ncbi:hypothetical protein LRP88_06562 [Fusarium phalaenopsidis]
MTSRVAAATPLYAYDDTPAVRLKIAILALANCEDIDLETEGLAIALPKEFDWPEHAALKAALDRCTANVAPLCPVDFVGNAPTSRTTGKTTPKKRAAPAGG